MLPYRKPVYNRGRDPQRCVPGYTCSSVYPPHTPDGRSYVYSVRLQQFPRSDKASVGRVECYSGYSLKDPSLEVASNVLLRVMFEIYSSTTSKSTTTETTIGASICHLAHYEYRLARK